MAQFLEERLLALTPEQFNELNKLCERCIALVEKSSQLRTLSDPRRSDRILFVIDKIESDRFMAEANPLNRQITDLLA